jgi:PRD domain protein (TIGR03582 family)
MLELDRPEIKQMILKSDNEEKCGEILNKLKLFIIENEMQPTDVQWISLVSHVSAMVNRSVNRELIQGLNASLFSEVTHASIEMAKLICGWLTHLHEDEKYLLSIHFENIKNNKQ